MTPTRKWSPLFHTALLGVCIMSLFSCKASDKKGPVIRRPVVAGQFYTGNPDNLRKEVEQFLSAGKKLDSYPQIIISPHAGYVFSGPVAGIGFAAVDPGAKRVILMGPSHRKMFSGVSIPDVDEYETPLGNVPLAKETIKKMRGSGIVHAYPDAHEEEHCLEVQLPFLQVILSGFSIVPIICGNVDPSAVTDLVYPYIDNKTLVVVSSDFSHYHANKTAKEIDRESVNTILAGELTGPIDACGEIPIRVAMHLSKKAGLVPKLLDIRNSYETAPQYGSEGRVVGYATIAYLKEEGNRHAEDAAKDNEEPQNGPGSLSDGEKRFLVKLAREALNRAVKGEGPPEPKDVPPVAKRSCGCFVTLTKGGRLRGCIGYIEGIKELYSAVIENAKNAALSDPRFPPVTPKELDDIEVEVSVLTMPVPLEYENPDDLLLKLAPMKDGIILKKGFRQATFLPQVWEQLPDKVEFLEHLSMKAGLGRGDWKTAEYRRYHAIHFKED